MVALLLQVPSPKLIVRSDLPAGVTTISPCVSHVQPRSRTIGVVMVAVQVLPLRSVPVFVPEMVMICGSEEEFVPDVNVIVR